ncbi:uncharacterized protein [Antedon mediterranea]|uniref:uncharacterized protein n=1 Tax=Antedon mediterranea TaxID=105859 RepID=UPI003AF7621A
MSTKMKEKDRPLISYNSENSGGNDIKKLCKNAENDEGNIALDPKMIETSKNVFLTLPDEIMIFNILPLLDLMEVCICKAVCKRWKCLIHAYFSQLKELDLTPWSYLIEEDHLISIIRHTRCLRYLRLSVCWKAVTECSLSSIASSCRNLEVFAASKCGKLTDSAITKLVTRCHNIQELDLSSCYNITDNALIEIARHCKNIKELYLSSIYSVTDIGVNELAKHSKTLEELDVSYCFTLTNDSMLQLAQLKQFGSLKSLRIKGCSKVSEETALKLMQTGIEVNNMF